MDKFIKSEESIVGGSRRKSGKMKFWLLLIAIIIVASGGVYYFKLIPVSFLPGDGGDIQAVFLVNNQVYFGKLSGEKEVFPVLRDVYYLQVTQALQPGAGGQTASNINLIKLGGELHGPTDMMKISRSQILFIENLSPNSKVLQAINSLKTPGK